MKTNPYNHELIYQIFEDPSKMKETWNHMQEFYDWGLISKREFKKLLLNVTKSILQSLARPGKFPFETALQTL